MHLQITRAPPSDVDAIVEIYDEHALLADTRPSNRVVVFELIPAAIYHCPRCVKPLAPAADYVVQPERRPMKWLPLR